MLKFGFAAAAVAVCMFVVAPSIAQADFVLTATYYELHNLDGKGDKDATNQTDTDWRDLDKLSDLWTLELSGAAAVTIQSIVFTMPAGVYFDEYAGDAIGFDVSGKFDAKVDYTVNWNSSPAQTYTTIGVTPGDVTGTVSGAGGEILTVTGLSDFADAGDLLVFTADVDNTNAVVLGIGGHSGGMDMASLGVTYLYDGVLYYESVGFTGYNYHDANAELTLVIDQNSPQGEVVPEPVSMLLFGTAIAGAVAARRRKRK